MAQPFQLEIDSVTSLPVERWRLSRLHVSSSPQQAGFLLGKNMKQPSKAALRRADREAKKLERKEEKARKDREIAFLLDRAQELSSCIPPEFQDWGITKTRAYLRLCAITKRKVCLIRPPLDVLKKCISELESHPSWSIDRCAQLAMLPETAKENRPQNTSAATRSSQEISTSLKGNTPCNCTLEPSK